MKHIAASGKVKIRGVVILNGGTKLDGLHNLVALLCLADAETV
jgi:hypothetical protein